LRVGSKPPRVRSRNASPRGGASVAAVLALALLAASPAPAQAPIKQGDEFRVNAFTSNNQYNPAISASASGDFVVTWTDNGHDGYLRGIFGQRFSSSGMRVGTDFQVNTYTTQIQQESSVAAENNGDFVVVWQSYHQDGPGAAQGRYGSFGQRFGSNGARIGVEFMVNTYTSDHQQFPRVASDVDGDFVVVWESRLQDGSGFGIFGRRFDSSGAALASEFQINSFTASNQQRPAVALDADGDFVVAWESVQQDGQEYGIFAKRFNSSGGALATEFQVNSYTTQRQNRPVIAAEADGDFVVAWQSMNQDGPVGGLGGYGIFARRFTSAGAPQAVEFMVNVRTTNYQRFPAIATDNAGNFVVTWESSYQDGDGQAAMGRRVTGAGTAFGPEFQANTYTVDGQRETAVAFTDGGEFVVTWRTDEPQDGAAYGVFAQRLSLPPLAVLDIDGNGALAALTDGLLYLRYRFALTGNALTASAVGANCTRCDSAAIIAYLDGLGNTLDIDGNMSFSALTDGLLLVRYLFGLGGTSLTSGVVGAGCTRCDAAAIVPYMQTLD
jgi:hypothetical protein